MTVLLKTVFIALLLLSAYAAILEGRCADANVAEVEAFMMEETGLTVQQVRDKLELSEQLSQRSFRKTWSSHLSLGQFQNSPFAGAPVQANVDRFSHPFGESSGGYGISQIPVNPVLAGQVRSARLSAELSFQYMIKLSGEIEGFSSLVPENAFLDGNCDSAFRSTHAELKSMTRLVVEGTLPAPAARTTALGTNVFLSVSRHMCSYCRRIIMHLALNGNRKIFIASPREGSQFENPNVFRPEYGVFQRDGSLKIYKRKSENAAAAWSCTTLSFDEPPAGATNGFIPPDNEPAGIFEP